MFSRLVALFALGPAVLQLLAAPSCGADTTPPPAPTPTPGAPTPCSDGFGLCGREANQTCLITSFAEAEPVLTTERAFPNLSFSSAVFLTSAPDGRDEIYVVEKAGVVRVFENDPAASTSRVFVDLRDRVSASANEMGLLGLAFHPRYAQNGYVYVDYTAASPRRTVISRFNVADTDPPTLDPASEQILLTVDQPFSNHNGGMVAFGPDGYLYVGLGDGGSAGDPYGAGQDTQNLLAKMLRLDVDNPAAGKTYGWPADNPFASGVGGRPEIWAWGVRNPWRFSFDRLLGTLWVGDVGQDAWEEIDVMAGPGNYGWNVMEGTHCYEPASGCDPSGTLLPVYEYPHSEGRSVTGGYVYRGARLPELYGRYVFGDYANGRIWALSWDGEAVTQNVLLSDTDLPISSFGEDAAGELYVVALSGTLHRLVRQGGAPASGEFPTRLSETGCWTDLARRIPAPGVYPYDVNSPLWSDGDVKARFLALPGLEQASWQAQGPWSFPDGTVLWKDFAVLNDARDPSSRRLLETRLLLKLDGEWRGYTYKWDEDGRDAYLLDGALTETLQVIGEDGAPKAYTHYYPSRSDCQACHTPASGQVLGVKTNQLNRDHNYWGVVDNQLRAFDHIGLLDPPLAGDPDGLPRLPDPADTQVAVADRARSYLDANCAHCHLPGGTAISTLDLRWETPLADTLACGVEPSQGDMGVPGSLILYPGQPEKSTLWLRMSVTGTGRMPPLASGVVDGLGVSVVDGWIEGQTTCP